MFFTEIEFVKDIINKNWIDIYKVKKTIAVDSYYGK